MKNIYQFSISTGASKETARTLSIVQGLGMPLDITAVSKPYDEEDDCIRECILFVNAQNKALPDQFKTAVEANPFLAGQGSDMTQEQIDFHANRWDTNEIMKVISYASKEVIPLHCSIYKTLSSDGVRINGTNTNN